MNPPGFLRGLVLLGLVLLALVLRLGWMQHEPIFPDALSYLSMSRGMLQCEWFTTFREGVKSYFPPLYPFLTALGSLVVGDMERAGSLVALAAGVGLVPVVFLMTRTMYGAPPAWIAAGLTAISPLLIHWSAHLLTESLFIFFFVAAAAAGYQVFRTRSIGWAVFAGILCGLAYLTRFVGIVIGPTLIVWLLLAGRIQGAPRKATIQQALLLGFGFLLVVLPYWMYLRLQLGAWSFSGSYGSIAEVVTATTSAGGAEFPGLPAAPALPAFFAKIFHNLSALGLAAARVLSLSLIFAVPLVFSRHSDDRFGATYLLTFVVVYGGSLSLLPPNPYQGELIRYLSPLAPFVFVMAAGGILVLARQWPRRQAVVMASSTAVIGMALVFQAWYVPGLFFFSSPWRPLPESPYKTLGVWVRDHLDHPLAIMARKPYVAYYAEATWFMTPHTLPEVHAMARSRGVGYLLIDRQADITLRPELAPLLDPRSAPEGLEFVAGQSAPVGPPFLVLYRIRPE